MTPYPRADLPELPPSGALGEPAPAAAKPVRPPAAIAALHFLDPDAVRTVVPLRFPFTLDGADVREVTIRRLAVGEVGRIVEGLGEDDPLDLYDFYAAMTGLPASVLRGLLDDDGAEVADAARPLLPRLAEAVFFSRISGTGDATPSPAPGA